MCFAKALLTALTWSPLAVMASPPSLEQAHTRDVSIEDAHKIGLARSVVSAPFHRRDELLDKLLVRENDDSDDDDNDNYAQIEDVDEVDTTITNAKGVSGKGSGKKGSSKNRNPNKTNSATTHRSVGPLPIVIPIALGGILSL